MAEIKVDSNALRQVATTFREAAARFGSLYSSNLLAFDQDEAMNAIGDGRGGWDQDATGGPAYQEAVREWRVPLRKLADILTGASTTLLQAADGYDIADRDCIPKR
jgi:uncharacterized protein YukE